MTARLVPLLLVHDTAHELSRPYRAGARAYRAGTPFTCNPHRADSRAYFDWDAGHANEAAGEHFRFGRDVLARWPGRPAYIQHDPAVPRLPCGDVEDVWETEVRRATAGPVIPPLALARGLVAAAHAAAVRERRPLSYPSTRETLT